MKKVALKIMFETSTLHVDYVYQVQLQSSEKRHTNFLIQISQLYAIYPIQTSFAVLYT